MATAPDLSFRSNINPFNTMSQLTFAQSKDGSNYLPVLHGEQSNPIYFRIYNNFAMNNGIASAVNVQVTTFDSVNNISHTAFNAPVSQLWLHVMESAYGENSVPMVDLTTNYNGTDTPVGSNNNVYYIEESSDGIAEPIIRAGDNQNGVGYVELESYVSVPATTVGGNYPFVISVIYEWSS